MTQDFGIITVAEAQLQASADALVLAEQAAEAF